MAPKKKTAAKAVKKKAAPKKAAKKAKPVKKASPMTAAPKTASRAAPKRAAPKRAKPTNRISLSLYDVQEVPEEQHFYFANGHKVKNIKELAQVMDRIEQEVFEHHVNPEKNDFHSWVKHVFNDIELAEKLIGVTGPKHLQFTIYKHVADKALKK